MSKIGQFLGGSSSRWFVSIRGISTGLSLGLALTYTKLLGVEKRSILVFIMVSALILTFILTSGMSLALRNKPPADIKDEEYFGFLALITVAGFFVAVINCVLLLLYSQLKGDIPGPIYVVCFIYTFFACVNMGFQDALLATGNLKLSNFLEITTVLMQFLSMTFFFITNQTSLMISVFISFIFSYTVITFSTGITFLNSLSLNFQLLSNGMRSILTQSRQQHLFGIANGLVDRIDRFLIGLILPISFLAKYALLSSIISFARFLPDAALKLTLLRHHQNKSNKSYSANPRTVVTLVLTGIAFVLMAQVFIKLIFGQVWLLPLSVGLLFLVQEVLRGNYQIQGVRLIALGGRSEMSKISITLIISCIFLISVGITIFGILGAPLAMVCVYLILTILINIKLKKLTDAN